MFEKPGKPWDLKFVILGSGPGRLDLVNLADVTSVNPKPNPEP